MTFKIRLDPSVSAKMIVIAQGRILLLSLGLFNFYANTDFIL